MTSDMRRPKYGWGLEVQAAADLYNDGSLPDIPEDLLLVAEGGPGEIVQVGHLADADVPLYMVDFGVAVIGCLEEEIRPVGRVAEGPVPGRMEAL